MREVKQIYLRAKEIAVMIGVNRQTIHKWAYNGSFPKPIKLCARCSVWPSEVVLTWINEHRAKNGLSELSADSVF
ncbi:MAG: AlpA family phage regulatory protein [Deltaproteobacteria bacterium]|jgi:predicted DNA-binding transcriptional regulator AlpA|nr:AlpA family phage regulatory protein [Deltaproteobacteria bacterium]